MPQSVSSRHWYRDYLISPFLSAARQLELHIIELEANTATATLSAEAHRGEPRRILKTPTFQLGNGLSCAHLCCWQYPRDPCEIQGNLC